MFLLGSSPASELPKEKTEHIQNKAKVWNQEYFISLARKLQEIFDSFLIWLYIMGAKCKCVVQNVAVFRIEYSALKFL